MKYLILVILLCSCTQTEEQKKEKKAIDFIVESCAGGDFYGTICQLSVGDTTSCHIRKYRSSVAVDCAMYDELVRRLK